MKPKVYLETSVISYLTARLGTNLIVAAHQQLTAAWWEERSKLFSMFVSQPVIDEAAAGDKGAAEKRLAIIKKISVLDVSDQVVDLAEHLIRATALI